MSTITIRAGRSGDGPEIIVDEEDYHLVDGVTWSACKQNVRSKTLYARRTVAGSSILLHRLVMKAHKGQIIDHIDGNGLNNSKANLRFVTHAENCRHAHTLPGRYEKEFPYKNVVRRRLKDGTIRTYVYDRRPASRNASGTRS